MNDKSILFYEEQRFRKNWLMVLLLIAIILPIGFLVSAMARQQMSKMEFVLSLIAVMAIEIPIFIFFYYTKLQTSVTAEGLGYRWWPLQRKYRILFKDDLSEIKMRKSPALTYGVHWIPGYGWIHNVNGRMGFQMKLKSGKKLYIGSNEVDKLRTALERVLNKPIEDFRNEF